MNTPHTHGGASSTPGTSDNNIGSRTLRSTTGGSTPSEPSTPHRSPDKPLFQQSVLAHLDAGYNLALWMLREEHLAGDALQNAALKAWRRFDSFRGGDGKSWFLAIVRTSALDLTRHARRDRAAAAEQANESAGGTPSDDSPLSSLVRREHASLVNDIVWSLSDASREILVLREIEGMSYAQMANVLDIPLGTVMSRVSRARDAAAAALRERLLKERTDGV